MLLRFWYFLFVIYWYCIFYHQCLFKSGIDENQIIKFALDEIDNAKYRNPFELNKIIKEKTSDKNKRYYVFIDEIQFVNEIKKSIFWKRKWKNRFYWCCSWTYCCVEVSMSMLVLLNKNTREDKKISENI